MRIQIWTFRKTDFVIMNEKQLLLNIHLNTLINIPFELYKEC